MISTLTALAALGISTAAIEINVNVQNGQTLAGEFTFRVTVRAEKPVTQVEFYVGDELRDSDSSTPYEFHLDTLAEPEGELRIAFAAYTTENESAKKVFTLRVDNGIALGADHHVQAAMEALSLSKWDAALQSARVALKAKPGHNPARLAMARAYLGKGVLDSAQKFAEDAAMADPSFKEARELLTAINLQRAFNTFHRSGEQRETLEAIKSALRTAVELRKKNVEAYLDQMGRPTPDNVLQYADQAIKAHRYSAAISALRTAFQSDAANPAIVNRLAYAQLRTGRFADATITFAESKRRETINAYGYALLAIIDAFYARDVDADRLMNEAFLSDPDDFGVRSAQAYIALARGRLDVLGKVARDLARDDSAKTEVQYYLASLYNALGQFTEARRAFERCVLAEPLNYDMFVARGTEALTLVMAGKLNQEQNAYQIQVARAFFETALVAKPESAEALTGLALAAVADNKEEECLRFARAAVSAMPNYAPGRYTLAMALSRADQRLRAQAERVRLASRDGNLTPEQQADIRRLIAEADRLVVEAQRENIEAGKLDVARLQGRSIPRSSDAFNYFARYGRLPLIAAPK